MTGYVAQLEKNNWNLKKWLIETIPRNFGLLLRLRDESFSLNKKDIIKLLENDSSADYHRVQLENAEAEYKIKESKNNNYWSNLYTKEKKEFIEDLNNDVKKYEEMRNKYDGMITKIKGLKNKIKKKDEITNNILNFAIEQLDSTKEHDFNLSYLGKKEFGYKSVNSFRTAKLSSIKWNIKYHKKEMNKEIKRKADILTTYIKYVNFIEENFPNGQTPNNKKRTKAKLQKTKGA